MRIALGVAYEGSAFHGWQSQPDVITVQATVEKALTQIAHQPIKVICAGRTDAGVHALGQVVHFDSPVSRCVDAWVKGSNAHLPASVKVQWACAVDEDFHARFGALARTYHYQIYQTPAPQPCLDRYWLHIPWTLSVSEMRLAAALLIGRHDFSSFRAGGCQAHSPVREITALSITETAPQRLLLSVTANAFLQNMVRNLVGSLLLVGSDKRSVAWFDEVFLAKDRRRAGPCAPAHGLHFMGPTYPAQYPQVNAALRLPT